MTTQNSESETAPAVDLHRVVRELAENFRAESERWWAAATKEPTGKTMFTKYIERAESWAMAAERVEAEIEKLPNDKLTDGGHKTHE